MRRNQPVDPATVDAFEARLEALCVEFNVILEHEDGHGSAYLVRPNPEDYLDREPHCAISITGGTR
jgi:hypothetical protein